MSAANQVYYHDFKERENCEGIILSQNKSCYCGIMSIEVTTAQHT